MIAFRFASPRTAVGLAVTTVACAAMAAPADAAPRSGSLTVVPPQRPSLEPIPPEGLRTASLSFDPNTGSITVAAAFYPDPSGFSSVDSLEAEFELSSTCGLFDRSPAITITMQNASFEQATASLDGFAGRARGPIEIGADRRSLSATITHPEFAGRDLRCVTLHADDRWNDAAAAELFWLEGYEPGGPLAPPEPMTDDAWIRAAAGVRVGCGPIRRARGDQSWAVIRDRCDGGGRIVEHHDGQRWQLVDDARRAGVPCGFREIPADVADRLDLCALPAVRRRASAGDLQLKLRYDRPSRGSAVAPDPVVTVSPASPALSVIDPLSALPRRWCSYDGSCGVLTNYAGLKPIYVADTGGGPQPEIAMPLQSLGAHCCSFAAGFWIDPNGDGPGRPAWRSARLVSGSTLVQPIRGPGLRFAVGDPRFEYGFTAYAFAWRPLSEMAFTVSRDASRATWKDVTSKRFLRSQLRRVSKVIRRARDRWGLEGTLPAKAAIQLRLRQRGAATATLRRYGQIFGAGKARRAKAKLRRWGYL